MEHPIKFSALKFVPILVIVCSGSALAQGPRFSGGDAAFLAGKKWILNAMEGRKLTGNEPYLEFDRDSKRASGSGGCNRFSGGFVVSGSSLKFSALVSTKRACLDSEHQRVEASFFKHLEATTRYELAGSSLSLFANNVLVLAFQAKDVSPGAPTAQVRLGGTSWRFMKFQGSDGSTLTPGKSEYTITFERDGRVNARIDCNRGNGTWSSSGLGQLQFGPLATTRAMCQPGSL